MQSATFFAADAPLALANDPSLHERLLRQGLGDQLLFEPGREVRRIRPGELTESLDFAFIVKRSWKPMAPRTMAKSLLRWRSPLHPLVHEARHCIALREAGFPVMKVIACGQRTMHGVPFEAFMLAEEVVGVPGVRFWNEADAAARRRLLGWAAQTLGRAHAAGFMEGCRLTDLIVEFRDGKAEPEAAVMIDREFSRRAPFTIRGAAAALAFSYESFFLGGVSGCSLSCQTRFLRNYLSSLSRHGVATPSGARSLRDLIVECIHANMREHPHLASAVSQWASANGIDMGSRRRAVG